MRFFFRLIIVFFCLLCLFSTSALYQNRAYQESGVFCIDQKGSLFPLRREEIGNYTSFKLGKITLNVIENQTLPNEVYLGGQVVGIGIREEGVIVVGTREVITQKGVVKPIKDGLLKSGDILLKINDRPIKYTRDIEKEMSKEGKKAVLHLTRDDCPFSIEVTPAKDVLSGKNKLGLFVKECVEGIGTLTYIRKDNGRFGALGHGITDAETGKPMRINNGDLYDLSVNEVTKGRVGKAGCLNGIFIDKKISRGKIDCGNSYGIYGFADSMRGKTVAVGDRTTVKCGKAQLVSNLSGKEELYDIEIVKASFQPMVEEKGMVIKITDTRLIEKTGGIVQGMSGSPILQNGKLVGAVTHVFINDPLRGYGLYIDFMLGN